MEILRVRELSQQRLLPNLWKLPLFYAIWTALSVAAFLTPHEALRWPLYAAIGYMSMGLVTFMHDATHNTLFRVRWLNRAFGIFAMIPLLTTFVAFKEDHLDHHRHNRSKKDPDAFTMGKRGWADYLAFYGYAFIGGPISFVYFTFIYPIVGMRGRKLAWHMFELALHVAIYAALLAWAAPRGYTQDLLRAWFFPFLFFGLFNSVRFIAEHYDTPWEAGQLLGTRTILSNPVNNFFWNNINYHIGHHVYPSVPWYNLKTLHEEMLPHLKHVGATIDRSYWGVFMYALSRGPESPERTRKAPSVAFISPNEGESANSRSDAGHGYRSPDLSAATHAALDAR